MRLGINLRDQTFRRARSLGILNASLGMTRALAENPSVHELVVATNRELGEVAGPARAGLIYEGLERRAPRHFSRVVWDHWGVTSVGARRHVDWMFLPKGFPPLARWPASRVCAYIHDDFVIEQPGRQRGLHTQLERAYFGSMLRAALTRADLIVTNSQFTLERLQRLHTRRTAIEVLGLGFDAVPESATREHLLLLTSEHPHKLTRKAIAWLEAWDDLRVDKHPIVGVGQLPRGLSWPKRPHWRHVQRPPEREYRALLGAASAVVYFSAYEGYGLPPREALQQKLWTLASDLPALREDIPACCLFDNEDFEGFRAVLSHIVTQALAGLAPPAFTLPSWSSVATRLVDAMHRATALQLAHASGLRQTAIARVDGAHETPRAWPG